MSDLLPRIAFSLISAGVVLSLSVIKKSALANAEKKTQSNIAEFLDWMETEVDHIPRSHIGEHSTAMSPGGDSEVAGGENTLYRALAAVGLVPTSPRQARVVRSVSARRSNPAAVHPATDNDDMADDVVRVQRVSEAEEVERYFSAFAHHQ